MAEDNYADEWTWKNPIADEDLKLLKSIFSSYFLKIRPDVPTCTCDGCPRERICTLAWDSYNTDGDCLYDK